MQIAYEWLFPVLWTTWCACWLIASRHVKVAVKKETAASRLLHIIPLVLAVVLLWAPMQGVPVLGRHFMRSTVQGFWIGAALTVAGLLFTAWARVVLGRNWSGIVTVKEGHELITSGPYRLVRHPIYTGLLLAFTGSAIARAEWCGVLAVALVFAALWRKLRNEERWMREQFGAAYDAYSQRVSALVPGLL
ncbi:MAG TPA: isoprenylcysteine carboxylmethyltransferase family protein [Steroidobacteraceae bacterium]|nr:isoprenylcysteine carboxylmethyltransferase family protein [Steroidobacteraceae bacterium]